MPSPKCRVFGFEPEDRNFTAAKATLEPYGSRLELHMQPYVLPTGQITPCCAIMVEARDRDLSSLPNIADTPLHAAYDKLCDMFEDPNSELSKICSKCQW